MKLKLTLVAGDQSDDISVSIDATATAVSVCSYFVERQDRPAHAFDKEASGAAARLDSLEGMLSFHLARVRAPASPGSDRVH